MIGVPKCLLVVCQMVKKKANVNNFSFPCLNKLTIEFEILSLNLFLHIPNISTSRMRLSDRRQVSVSEKCDLLTFF